MPAGVSVKAIALGSEHSCALVTGAGGGSEMSVMCWGDGSRGLLGTGSTTPQNTPVDVVLAAGNVYFV